MNKEDAYIKKGFSLWKKALKCFYEHQNSPCHKTANSYHLVVPRCTDVGESMDNRLATFRDCKFFSIMADKGTNISNLEQPFFCARTVYNDLNVLRRFSWIL